MPQKVYQAAGHMTVMRPLDQNGGIGGYSDRKPSKLEQMRADYQKKLLKEKEEKMVHLYEENQRKAMMRLTKNGHGGTGEHYSNGAGSPTGGKSVREFFNERRRLEAAGAPVPSIDQHYKQAKGYASPGGWSSRAGSGTSLTKGSHMVHGGKSSAGRDRGQPLAPIQRHPSLATETVPATMNNNINNAHNYPNQDARLATNGNTQARSGIPLRQYNSHVSAEGSENPFSGRPTLIKHKPLPPTTNGHSNGADSRRADAARAAQGKPPAQPSSLPRYVPAKKQPEQQQQQQQQQQQHHLQRQPQQQTQQPRQPHPPPGAKQGNIRAASKPRTYATKATPVSNGFGANSGPGGGKLTDFQKWQLEQNQAREERLKKLGSGASASPDGGHWGHDENGSDGAAEEEDEENGFNGPVINGRGPNKDRLNRLNGHIHVMEEGGDGDDDVDDDDNDVGEDDIPEEDEDAEEKEKLIKEQERALLEQIAAKQREVERLRKEREDEEEEERREQALQKKRDAAERARQKKLDDERRKEEERQRKQEEEEERQERKREEQRHREDEKRRKEDEKRRREEEKRLQDEERKAAKRQAEEDRRLAKKQQQQQSSRSAAAASSGYGDFDDRSRSPVISSRQQHNANETFRAGSEAAVPIDDKPVAGAAGDDARFYMQAAASSDAKGSVGSLVPCRQCGRKFAHDRIKKHQDACVKANKPRKEYNAAMKRVEGTELAKYAGKNRKPDPPKKKSNWRAHHEQFIESLRYAKKVTEYEKEGKDLKELAPPPPTQNPDLVACPHCGRTFNEQAANRHIPRCQALKTRPPPMNTRRR